MDINLPRRYKKVILDTDTKTVSDGEDINIGANYYIGNINDNCHLQIDDNGFKELKKKLESALKENDKLSNDEETVITAGMESVLKIKESIKNLNDILKKVPEYTKSITKMTENDFITQLHGIKKCENQTDAQKTNENIKAQLKSLSVELNKALKVVDELNGSSLIFKGNVFEKFDTSLATLKKRNKNKCAAESKENKNKKDIYVDLSYPPIIKGQFWGPMQTNDLKEKGIRDVSLVKVNVTKKQYTIAYTDYSGETVLVSQDNLCHVDKSKYDSRM